jgi:hypothetical protein
MEARNPVSATAKQPGVTNETGGEGFRSDEWRIDFGV